MKTRTIATLAILIMILSLVGACGKGDKALDVAGLSLGKDLSGMLGKATTLLGGITDLDSAKAALPKLNEMNTGLDGIVAKAAKLSPESKDSFVGLVHKAMPALEGAMTKVMELPGVGDTLRPTMESMMSKIKSLL